MRPSLILPAALTAAVWLLPSAAVAAGPQPPDCPLLAPKPAQDHPIGATKLVARDPYGGLLPRNRLFFDFAVRGPKAAEAGVARVEWALDGVTKRTDDRAPYEWKGLSGSSARMPAGEHVVKVTVVPTTGSPASAEFPLTATDCQLVAFQSFLSRAAGKGVVSMSWESAFESDKGAPLTQVAAEAVTNVVTALPSGVRGRAIGTVAITRTGAPQVKRTLRAPRRGTTLLRAGDLRVTMHPGARRFLTVTGLPQGTQGVQLELNRAGTRMVHPRNGCKTSTVRGVLQAGTATASSESGGHYAC